MPYSSQILYLSCVSMDGVGLGFMVTLCVSRLFLRGLEVAAVGKWF
jgi:hypothetical protein